MVMLSRNAPIETYEVYDDTGRCVGRIVLPTIDPRTVDNAETGTVFLRRQTPAIRGLSLHPSR